MLTIVPTIDTEGMHGTRPFEQFILGQVDGSSEDWGTFRIADICQANGVPATFFVDVYEKSFWGVDKMRDLCRKLTDSGFDVQLHTHPGWRDDPHDFPELRKLKSEKSYLSQEKDFMAKLSQDQQEQILREGMDMIEDWTGVRPVAHRSGGYSINNDTISALVAVGIALDSSMYSGHAHSEVTWSQNAIVEKHGLLELPVTLMNYAFHLPVAGTLYRKPMKTDLDSCTLDELIAYVDAASDAGLKLMNLFMHSYSLLAFDHDYRRIEGDPADAHKLNSFLEIMSHRDDVRIMSCADVLERYRVKPDEFVGPDFMPKISANTRIIQFALAKARNLVHQGFRKRIAVPDVQSRSASAPTERQ